MGLVVAPTKQQEQGELEQLPAPTPWPNANARLLGVGAGLPVNPLDRLAQFSPKDFERFTLEWATDYLARKGDVDQVQQRGGAGDKGRDVIVWIDPPSITPRRWKLYQCKHYAVRLGPPSASSEIGKVLYYTKAGAYHPPEEYWFVTHWRSAIGSQELGKYRFDSNARVLQGDRSCSSAMVLERRGPCRI
jgi:hypothetical protein